MSAPLMQFEIITPERIVLREEINGLTVPTEMGEITVLPGHIPLVSIVKPGVIIVHREAGDQGVLATSGGFLEVLEGKVVILADTAEMASQLDEERIKEARAKAEALKQQASNTDDVSFTEASAMLEKELARYKAVKHWRKLKS
ncbi:MAG: ATP synthase F1 subunit epsilon [Candidatus Falkowbacteria bacterium]